MGSMLPCPFCGDTDLEDTTNEYEWPVVQCNNCGALGPCIKLTAKEARSEWNARVSIQSHPAHEHSEVSEQERKIS